jgi:hypothetical protein
VRRCREERETKKATSTGNVDLAMGHHHHGLGGQDALLSVGDGSSESGALGGAHGVAMLDSGESLAWFKAQAFVVLLVIGALWRPAAAESA